MTLAHTPDANTPSITLKQPPAWGGYLSSYPSNMFVGKSLLRLKSGHNNLSRVSDDDVYDKWSQALSSAVELVRNACSLANTLHKKNYYSAFIPVVVVPDGLIWQSGYDENGEMTTDPIKLDDCAFYVGRRLRVGTSAPTRHVYTISHLHFCTVRGLEQRVRRLAENPDEWARLMTKKATEEPDHGGEPTPPVAEE